MIPIPDCLLCLPTFARYQTLVKEAAANNNYLKFPISDAVRIDLTRFVSSVVIQHNLPLATKDEATKLRKIVSLLPTNLPPDVSGDTRLSGLCGDLETILFRLNNLVDGLSDRIATVEDDVHATRTCQVNAVMLQLGAPLRTIRRHNVPLPDGIPAAFASVEAIHGLTPLQLKNYIIYLTAANPANFANQLSHTDIPDRVNKNDLVKAVRGLLGVPSQSAVTDNQFAFLSQRAMARHGAPKVDRPGLS